MNLRMSMRDEFPRGWWRSMHWWLTGLRELVFYGLAALTTVLLISKMACAVRQRHSPRALARMQIPVDCYVAGLLVGCTGLWVLTDQVSRANDQVPVVLIVGGMLLGLLFLANIVVAVVVLLVLGRSRIRHQDTWAQLDFIERHAPKDGRPPETVEEYRALQLKTKW